MHDTTRAGGLTLRFAEPVVTMTLGGGSVCVDTRYPGGLSLLAVFIRRDVDRYGAEGFVYFAKAAGRVKIGYSAKPAKRIAELQTGCPVALEVLGWMPGSPSGEGRMHAMFSSLRARGEWFEAEPWMMALIGLLVHPVA